MTAFTTEEDKIILDAIIKLKGAKADVFHLFVNGMSIGEITKALEIPYNTVTFLMTHLQSIFDVNTSFQLLATVLPAMIRRECDEFAAGDSE